MNAVADRRVRPASVPIVLDLVLVATPLALMAAAYRIAERQMDSPDRELTLCSNGRVIGISALCVLASGVCTLGAVVVALLIRLANSGFRT